MLPKLGDWLGIEFYTQGTFLVLSAFVCLALLAPLLRRRDRNPGIALDLSLLALLGYGIGARLLHSLVAGPGPGTWGGQIAFGLLACGYFLSLRGPLRDATDALAVAWAALTLTTKIGCFLAGCCHGAPSTLPWALSFPREGYCSLPGTPLHPTQLYDAAAAFVIGVVLLVCFLRRQGRGRLILWFGMAASAAKFGSELFRGDGRPRISAGLPASMAAEAVMTLLCAAALIWPLPWLRLLERLEARPEGPRPPGAPAGRLRIFLMDLATAALALLGALAAGRGSFGSPRTLVVYFGIFLLAQFVQARWIRFGDAAGPAAPRPRLLARGLVQGLAVFTLLGLLRPLFDRSGRNLGDALAETWPLRSAP